MTLLCGAAEPVPSPLSERCWPVLESVPACCGRDCDASWSSENCCLCDAGYQYSFLQGVDFQWRLQFITHHKARELPDWLAAVGKLSFCLTDAALGC